jgi:hypothetical protein
VSVWLDDEVSTKDSPCGCAAEDSPRRNSLGNHGNKGTKCDFDEQRCPGDSPPCHKRTQKRMQVFM